MKEIILQKSNFQCRENIYICRLLRHLRRLAVEYVKKITACKICISIVHKIDKTFVLLVGMKMKINIHLHIPSIDFQAVSINV